MGVKLQLLLGLLLFGSICGLDDNNTASEKIDSTKNIENVIEKLPKTDFQINVDKKDTQTNPNSDSNKFSSSGVDSDTHRNLTTEENEDSSEYNSKNNVKERQGNSRSINLDRFASPDFSNNDYTSDNQKFIENKIHKSSTKDYPDFSSYQLATPTTKHFDLRYEEARQKIEQEYEENNPEHSEEHHLDDDLEDEHHDIHIDRLFGNSEINPNASLDYKERTKILKNNTFDDNSEHNRFSVVKVQKLNFASEYNVSTFDDDDTTPNRDNTESTSPKIFFSTRKPIKLTKPPTSHSNHILNNKIESETIKAINSLTTEFSAAKRLNEFVPKEQNIEENKIISVETIKPDTVYTEYTTTTTGKVGTTTEQIKISLDSNETTTNPTTMEQPEILMINNNLTSSQTKDIKREDHTIKNEDNSTSFETFETSTILNTEQTTENNEIFSSNYLDGLITTESLSTKKSEEQETILTTLIKDITTTEPTTITPTTEDYKITTLLSKIPEESTNTPTEVTTIFEDSKQVTSQETTTDITAETNGRVSKSFSFENATDEDETTTLKLSTTQYNEQSETTTETRTKFVSETTDKETSETITSKLFSVTETPEITSEQSDTTTSVTTETSEQINIETTTEPFRWFSASETTTSKQVDQATDVNKFVTKETETTIEPKIEVKTTTETVTTTTSRKWETTTFKNIEIPTTKDELTTLTSLHETTSKIDNLSPRKNKSNIVTETTNSITDTFPFFTDIPTKHPSSVNEDTIVVTTSTEDYTPESSSSVPDAGNIGGIEDSKGKIAAIVISTVGAVSLILLAGLLYIMRKRQKRFNYKQRCRPVSLDHYSVDNVSGYNSTRRKAERQSKRSYGNPAFDDPTVLTHPLNLPALAKFATNTEDIKAEFEEIPQITAKISELPDGCETKNRYANVIPLPETRVFLQPIDGYPNSDYINANYVTGPKNTKGYYIACQAPMQNTVDDFWRMVWEQQSKVILMITHLFENGVEKCVDYLPPSEVLDCNRLFGDFQVTLKKRDVKDKYIISNLQLKNMVSNSWREVTHFWYLGWPEKGVPSEENSLIAFLIEARSYMKTSTLDKIAAANGNGNGPPKNEVNPVVVHCSPGTGRTGVVMACDIAIREFEQTRLVDIPKIVYRIRRDRASAVQTKEQYMLIYKVVSLYATKLTGGALESF